MQEDPSLPKEGFGQQEETDPEVRKAMLASVAAGSVVSWQHINLLGEYDFSDEKLRDSVGIGPPKILGLQAA